MLEKFGDVLACTSTVLQAPVREPKDSEVQVIFGSHDIGDLMIKIFRSGGSGRDQITMFVGSAWRPRALKSFMEHEKSLKAQGLCLSAGILPVSRNPAVARETWDLEDKHGDRWPAHLPSLP